MPAGHGLDGVLPVDLYLPGCPPNPAAIIEALLMFLDRAPQRVAGGRVGAMTCSPPRRSLWVARRRMLALTGAASGWRASLLGLGGVAGDRRRA